MVEKSLDDLLHPGGDDLGDIFHCYLGCRLVVFIDNLNGFFPEGGKLSRHACAVGLLDVLRKLEREIALGLDVPGDTVAAERYRGIVPHNLAFEYCDGADSGADVDKGHAILHLFFLKDGPGGDSGSEIFLGDGYSHAVEHIVDVDRVSPAADEHLEVPFKLLGSHSDNVVFQLIKTVFCGERLCHRPVDHFVFRVGQRIFLESHGLEGPDLIILDLSVRICPVHHGRGILLPDIVAGQADYDLLDLDLELLLRLRERIPQDCLDFAGIVDVAVADSLRGRLLVINHLDILAQDPGHAHRQLGCAQVDRRYVPFFHIILISCRLSARYISRSL